MEKLIAVITDNGNRLRIGPDANDLLRILKRNYAMQAISDKIGNNQYARMKATCIDCGEDFIINFERIAKDRIEIKNGALAKRYNTYMCKCQKCFNRNDFFGTNTEVYSRVVGYLRPVGSWNQAKKNEFHSRKTYKID